ncbi:MAG: SurA N-terminal domain-containing protein [Gammaproteobacteria bacterium]|nr:SurA N-terminal domain-containing protein [Gammaproteobacteria bacterium]
MLHVIRERATGWVAYFIVLIISIPFALWGISEYLGFGGGADVAEVNGQPIPIERYNELYQNNRSRNTPPSGVDSEQWERGLKLRVLDGLIDQVLLFQYLDSERLDVTDAKLAQSIQAMDLFRVDGRFDEERYQKILEVNRITPARFEADQREQMRTQIIAQMLADSALATDAEVREYQALKDQTRDIRYFEVKGDRFFDPDAVTEEEIKADYEGSQDRYMAPERVKVSYLELRLDSMDDGAPLSEEAVAEYYEARALDFMAPELRKLRQIFLKGSESDEQAQALYKRLQEGEDFAELAREHSQDELSRSRGGQIGWVAEEDLPEDLATLVFSLEPGKVSEPIKTERGVYLLDVQELEPARLQPLEEVLDQVVEQARRADLEGRYAAAAEELGLLAYENPESLAPAAEQLGMKIQNTDLVPLTALPVGVLTQEAVLTALRSDEVLRGGMNSDRIDLEVDWSIVVRVDEYEEARTLPLEAVADRIRNDLARQAAWTALLAHASELTERLREEPDIEALAESDGAKLITRAGLTRDAEEVPRQIGEKAFSLSRPEGSPSVGVAILYDGVALVAVGAVHEAPPAEIRGEDRENLRAKMRFDEAEAFRAALLAQAEVTRYPDRLE